jgi:hypothetical protein
MENTYCDGNGPHAAPPCRVYPLGAGGNLILCPHCWCRENAYRAERGRTTGNPSAWPQIAWDGAEVYAPSDSYSPTYANQLAHARGVLRREGLEALHNPHAMIGRACGCCACFNCAAFEVYREARAAEIVGTMGGAL